MLFHASALRLSTPGAHGIDCISHASQGEWANNKRHGQGKIVYVSGNTYEGAWREDKKSGYGVMQWFKLRERYAGEWAEDRQQGFGEHVWMDDKPAEGSLGVMKQVSWGLVLVVW
jgi:hypothetical protein